MNLFPQTFCGCFNLQLGAAIIGLCSIVFSLGAIINNSIDLEECKNEDLKFEIKIGIGYSYLYIIADVLLIYGSIKSSKYFLLPWLVYTAIGISAFTIFCVIFMVFAPRFIIGVVVCAGFWYTWICVLSYYNKINPINPPATTIYPNVYQFTNMDQCVVAYTPQFPVYIQQGKGPVVI